MPNYYMFLSNCCQVLQSKNLIICLNLKVTFKKNWPLKIPFLGVYPEKTIIWKDTCTPIFIHSSTTYNSQDKETIKTSLNRGLDEEDVVRTYNAILLRHKKEWNIAPCHSVDGPRDHHTKWAKSQRQTSYDVTCMWSLNCGTNELIYKTEAELLIRKQTWLPKGEWRRTRQGPTVKHRGLYSVTCNSL